MAFGKIFLQCGSQSESHINEVEGISWDWGGEHPSRAFLPQEKGMAFERNVFKPLVHLLLSREMEASTFSGAKCVPNYC